MLIQICAIAHWTLPKDVRLAVAAIDFPGGCYEDYLKRARRNSDTLR